MLKLATPSATPTLVIRVSLPVSLFAFIAAVLKFLITDECELLQHKPLGLALQLNPAEEGDSDGDGNAFNCNTRGVSFKLPLWRLVCSVLLGEKDREWCRQTYPATPPLSMWLARVTSSLQTSNCHLRRPRTPQSTLPVCMPIRMSTFMPVASRTCLPEEWERNEEWEIKANDEWGKQWKPQYTGIL